METLSTPQTKNFFAAGRSKSSEPQIAQPCSRVRVIVRVRPFLQHENNEANDGLVSSCISEVDPNVDTSGEVTVLLRDQESSRNESFKLDGYFGPEDNNVSKIFQLEVRPLLPHIFQGCNATVFAYGATGSGKTYTMQGSDEYPGVMSLAIDTVLSMCQETTSTVKISYYEIYMDRCYDLLELKEKEIVVLDDKDGKIHLKGLAQHQINSISEFNDVFPCIIQRRKVASTIIHNVSSRSHAVIVVTVSTPSQDCRGNAIIGKLNLIDLAGNEDNRNTLNEGIRLQESAKINQSLFALSNVIYALNNGNTHVPYRESKLTRILQDSLGGTSRSLMVACLNPGEYMESVNTVSLAARSRPRHISNSLLSAKKNITPKVKVDMEVKLQAWLESKGKSTGRKIGGFGSPSFSKTPTTVRCTKDAAKAGSRSAKPNLGSSNQCSLFSGKRVMYESRRNLFGHGGVVESAKKVEGVIAEKEVEVVVNMVGLKSKTYTDDDEPNTSSKCPGKKFKSPDSRLRKVLSPINSNIVTGNDDHHSTPLGGGQLHFTKVPFDLLPNNGENELEVIGTPLDKFQTHSYSLKSSLVQEYLELLNNASREELIEVKGIGEKYSEYIIELREESPLKSLNDLEKLGLSTKQVHNMFKKAARGVLE